MDIETCREVDEPVVLLDAAAESLRRFNHITIAGDLDPAAVYGALGLLAVAALRMPQAYEQLATSLRAEDIGGRFAADLANAKHAAVVMHEALSAAHSRLGELTVPRRPPPPAADCRALRP
jgi:hypothetical protein